MFTKQWLGLSWNIHQLFGTHTHPQSSVPQFVSTLTTMNFSKLFFKLTVILGILVLTTQATQAHCKPVHQPSPSPIPSSEQYHHLMVTYVAMIEKVACAQQEIWLLLKNQFNVTNSTTAHEWFEYCFLKDIANPPSNNITVRNIIFIYRS